MRKICKMFLLKICLTRQNYSCLWVQRNGVDNKENWRLGRASYLYFCKSAVATGTFFWPDIASALPVMQHWFRTQLHPRGEASEAASCSYWYTGVSAEMGCLAAGNNYFWNTGAVRLNWSLTCLSEELQIEKTLRFSVYSVFILWQLAICFLKKSD